MSSVEEQVARHYARGGARRAHPRRLAGPGAPDGRAGPDDLMGVDEFHMGGRAATDSWPANSPSPGTRLLDIGCGIGGPARFLAARYGCVLTAIDLTPEFIEAGTALTRMTGLSDKVSLRVGSGTDLPFDAAAFDAAMLIHVGMNIADKQALFIEVARVLRPGGRFAVYEAMRTGAGDLFFPLPWADSSATSFVASPEDYRRLLEEADFAVSSRPICARWRSRCSASSTPGSHPASPLPPLSLPLIMGAEAPRRIGNLVALLQAGHVAPIRIMAQRR